MPSVLSTLRSTLRNTADPDEHWKLTSLLWQPAIPFVPPPPKAKDKKKGTKDGDSSEDDVETVTIYAKINKDLELKDENSVAHKVPKFQDGTPEEYCTWRNNMEELSCSPKPPPIETFPWHGELL